MRPAPTPISGLAATMTSVSFQPFTKPMQKPHTKVVKRCRKMATWSAMASLILLMSLWTQMWSYDAELLCQHQGQQSAVTLTLTCGCWAPPPRCSRTSRSPSSSLCWSTSSWWVGSAWRLPSPTGRSVKLCRDTLRESDIYLFNCIMVNLWILTHTVEKKQTRPCLLFCVFNLT